MREFLYKQTFSSILRPVVSSEKDKYLALASLVEIGKFLPNLDTEKNFDLLPVAFNACVVNRINKNDDAITTETALAMYKSFIHKPINIEHHRDKVIGCILTAGFSEFGTDKPLTEEEVKNSKEPFNITLGGVVWRIVNEDLANRIEESSDPTSKYYLSVSASWELGLDDYAIAILLPGQKNLAQAKMITDKEEINKIKSSLSSNAGDGKLGDSLVYRIPLDVLPLGIGFTERPAADVQGIATEKNGIQVSLTEEDIKKATKFLEGLYNDYRTGKITKEELEAKSGCQFLSNLEPAVAQVESSNKISQESIPDVKVERQGHKKECMKITSIKDLTDDVLKQAVASDIADLISAELRKSSEVWEKEKNSLTDKLAKAESDAKKITEDYEKVKQELATLKAALEGLAKEKEERIKVEKFNSRMTEVNEAYTLDDEVRAALVEEIRNIDSDEDFGKWKKKASVLLKGFVKKNEPVCAKHSKTACEECKAEETKKTQAEAIAKLEKALEDAKKAASLPNTSAPSVQTLKEKYKNAFANENVLVLK